MYRNDVEFLSRLSRAMKLLQDVQKISENTWRVSKRNVTKTEEGYYCTCEDFVYRGVLCKHILAVILFENLVSKEENYEDS